MSNSILSQLQGQQLNARKLFLAHPGLVSAMFDLMDRLLGRSKRPEFENLLSESSFQRVLERERLRADRNHATLSLVQLRLLPTESTTITLVHRRRLERILADRIRSTDTLGLLSNSRVGVLLPETPATGARAVAADLVELWKDSEVRLDAKVSIYPMEQDGQSSHRPDDFDDRRSFSGRRNSIPQFEETGSKVEVLRFAAPLPAWKRLTDVLGASVGIVVLTPLLGFVALSILLTSGRPVMFKQQRAGLGGRPFWIYKFRTMCREAEARKTALRKFSEQDGPAFKLKSDPRLTRIGRYLRKSSIDELPQLWNVIRGDMTFVGPRPLPCDESDGCIGWQRRRLEVTPGLTCIWQVEGKSNVSFIEWMRMDLRYIRSRTPLQDMKLIGRTAIAVVLHRASQ